MKRRDSRDYTPDARRLFTQFAERYRLSYSEEPHAPIEVLWRFPAQAGLAQPIVLGLQGDELNFGVEKFWSYFFPFEDASASFETILAAWMAGDARVMRHALAGGLVLEVRHGQAWQRAYKAGFGWGRVTEVVRNVSA